MLPTLRIFSILLILQVQALHSQETNGCSQYLRDIHRRGPNVAGRLEIPTDELYPRYKLKVSFSSPIHHMTIRQLRAKDSGNHKDFVVDPMEMQRDGKLKLDVFIRLGGLFGPMSRMTRIVYNNVALCGDPLEESELDQSISVGLATSPAPSKRPAHVAILIPPNKAQTDKTNEFDEDDFVA